MLISIIIPLYNKEHTIKDTLFSVLNQTYKNFEIIIINDGSTDKSLANILNIKDQRIKIFNQQNKGVSSARNLGIENSNGDFISFLDADDYWYPNHLEEIIKLISRKQHLSVFTSLIKVETKNGIFNGNYSYINKEIYTEIDFFKSSYKKTILTISNSLFKKEIFDAIGIFNVNYHNGEDTDLFIRIGFKYKIGLVQKYTSIYKYVENSLTNQRFSMTNRYNFSNYTRKELKNPFAKKMIDINRFSLALKCKLINDMDSFYYLLSEIDLNNLEFKQKILIKSPRKILILLLIFKEKLELFKIKTSAF